MLLAIDAGNTQTHAGLFDGADLVYEWRTYTDARKTADDLAAGLKAFLSFGGESMFERLDGVVVASVVPQLTTELRTMVRRYLHFEPLVVEPGVRTGVPVLTDNPKEVGADRIANAVAAYALIRGPAVVVDFGTATTFDVISEKGEYLGGAIAPGVEISTNALAEYAAQIHKVELVPPRSVVGKSTVESLRSGVVIGSAAMAEGMVERIQKEMGGHAAVVVTGGLAPLVLAAAGLECRHEPNLTLEGLRLIHELNGS